MDKTRIKLIGKQLRRTYAAPDDLPCPIRKVLEQLAGKKAEPEREDYGVDARRNYAK